MSGNGEKGEEEGIYRMYWYGQVRHSRRWLPALSPSPAELREESAD